MTTNRMWELRIPTQWVEPSATSVVCSPVSQYPIAIHDWKFIDDWCARDIEDVYIEKMFEITYAPVGLEVGPATDNKKHSQLKAFQSGMVFRTCRVGEHICFVVRNKYPVKREFGMSLLGTVES